MRSILGAASNRLDHVYNNLQNMSTNTSAAKGRIMDVDYATETANMTTKQMLMQAGTSMLKQSNSMSQLALSLMQ
jgi:flagellin